MQCQLVIKPWEGLLCLECGWPLQRFEYQAVERNGEKILMQALTKAQRQWAQEQAARRSTTS